MPKSLPYDSDKIEPEMNCGYDLNDSSLRGTHVLV